MEISEGGVSAYLRAEFEAGPQVELELDLPTGPLELSAIVRDCLARAPLRFSVPATSSRTMSENPGELQRRTAVSVEPASGIDSQTLPLSLLEAVVGACLNLADCLAEPRA